MQNFFIFLTIFTIIFFGIDLIQKITNHKSKWSRKATHILSGIVVVFFPEFLSSAEIYALTIFFFFFFWNIAGTDFTNFNGIIGSNNFRIFCNSWI